ncbi:MAG: TonB-dependent receptor [Steroidobacteraceae bacterium]
MRTRTGKYPSLRAAVVATLGAATIGTLPSTALAQQGGTPAIGGLEEILVTARKRVESAQDVPVTMQVFSQQELEKKDLTSLEKIAASNPGLIVGRGGNGSGAQLTLRGISSQPISVGIEQSIAVVVDGVYYGQGRTINEGMLDAARVELLKGPQALFFGKNATAGVIAVTTADPGDKVEAMARAGYEFKAQEKFFEGTLSGPISETLGARLTVRWSDMSDSYMHNRGFDVTNTLLDINGFVPRQYLQRKLDRDLPGTNERFVRGTLKWEPNDRFTNTFKVSYMRRADQANAWNYVPVGCASGFTQVNANVPCRRSFDVYINYFPDELGPNVPYGRDDGSPFNLYRSVSFTDSVTYDFTDQITLTSVFNYQWNRNNWGCSCQNISTPASFIAATEKSIWKAFSNETRLQTRFDSPINLMVGLYYQDSNRDHSQAGAFGGLEDSTQTPDKRWLAYDKTSETDGKTWSAFGQLNWKLTDDLELATGVRYTHETKDSFLVQTYVNLLFQGLFPQDRPIVADQTFNNWSPEATLTWKATEDLTLFGAYKTAYKSGGFSNSALIVATTIPEYVAFDPETSRGFEFGFKSTLLDNQLRVNASVFNYKYKNLQVDYFNSITFEFITTNAGAARTKGAELEIAYAPAAAAGLTLRGALNYNKAKYLEYIAPCYGGQSIAGGCDTVFGAGPGQDLSGKPTAMAPKWNGAIGFDWEAPVGGTLRLGLSADARYSGKYFASNFAAPLSVQPSYWNLDASLRIGSENDRWEVAVIGRNLTNKFYMGGVQDLPNSGVGTGTVNGTPADQLGLASLPRTVRLQLTWRY